MLFQRKLEEIAAFIMANNTYFDRSFAFVEQSDTEGYIHNGKETVFPADYFGNFFYIRVPSKLGVIYNNSVDNANRSFGINVPLVVVACVKNADAYHLAENIFSTIGRMCDISKQFTSIVIHNEDVVTQELSKCSEQIMQKALQNMQDGMTFISVNFTLSYIQPFLQLNCITNPCKTCS